MRYVSIAAITIGISETKKVHRIYYSMNFSIIILFARFNKVKSKRDSLFRCYILDAEFLLDKSKFT